MSSAGFSIVPMLLEWNIIMFNTGGISYLFLNEYIYEGMFLNKALERDIMMIVQVSQINDIVSFIKNVTLLFVNLF